MQYAVEADPVRLLALDTLVAGEHHGLLCDERLAWLDARLSEAPDRPTVVFMHHPPFATGIPPMDRYGLRRPETLGAIIRQHPQVERILCGHLHRPIQVRWHGTVATTAPSTAHQVALNLEEMPLAFVMEPPACQLHLWEPGTGLISHTSYVGDYPGPYPFREARTPVS
jgi:hypothetical protein